MTIKLVKFKDDYDDYPIIITIPDVKGEPKLVLYDHEGQPLQRKIGYK